MRNQWLVHTPDAANIGSRTTKGLRAALPWLDRCTELFGLAPQVIPLVVHGDSTSCAPAWVQDRALHLTTALLDGAAAGAAASRLVLAHEAAHLVQSCRGGAVPDMGGDDAMAEVEAEASLAALSAGIGRPLSIKCSIPTQYRLNWGAAGHYYTVYYITLACGADPDEAARMAFYAQLPDLVDELSAMGPWLINANRALSATNRIRNEKYNATKKIREQEYADRVNKNRRDALESIPFYIEVRDDLYTDARIARNFLESFSFYNNAVIFYSNERKKSALELSVADDISHLKNMEGYYLHTGLHALTGENAGVERGKRRTILQKLEWGSWQFGLALHAFGDSHAHTNQDNNIQYGAGWGHAVDGTHPDRISYMPDRYLLYCEELSNLCIGKTGKTNFGIENQTWNKIKNTVNKINPVNQIGSFKNSTASSYQQIPKSEDDSIKMLKDEILKILGTPLGVQYIQSAASGPVPAAMYEPPGKPVPWRTFVDDENNKKYSFWPKMGDLAYLERLAKEWGCRHGE